MAQYAIHLGDCRDHLKSLASDSIESLVTDPPAGISFMGKAWDSYESLQHFQDDLTVIFKEVLRVLKPGAHGLVWALPRTSMFTGMALINAGFECRDSVVHLFGSGMPKGLDVAKAIDKMGGISAERQGKFLQRKREAKGLSRERLAEFLGCSPASIRDWEEGRARRMGGPLEWIIPSETYRCKLAEILGYSADERRMVGTAVRRADDRTVLGLGHTGILREGGATELSQHWQGWNSTLKPAHEVWWLVRKPLNDTIAGNVLKYGTGAVNIDACRLPTSESTARPSPKGMGLYHDDNWAPKPMISGGHTQGRWPANVVLSHSEGCVEGECLEGCAVAALDEQSGPTGGAPGIRHTKARVNLAKGDESDRVSFGYDELRGAASRFFYTAKISTAERKLPDGTLNQHPTAKSIKLMRYFVRLVTPPNGTVLDRSGTTGVAALKEGFSFIGIEQDPVHHRVAQLRLADAMPKPTIFDDMEG